MTIKIIGIITTNTLIIQYLIKYDYVKRINLLTLLLLLFAGRNSLSIIDTSFSIDISGYIIKKTVNVV